MEAFVSALWELRTWFALSLGVLIGLLIAALLMMARQQTEPDDGPKTILIPPVADEPMGEMVDVKELMRRYS